MSIEQWAVDDLLSTLTDTCEIVRPTSTAKDAHGQKVVTSAPVVQANGQTLVKCRKTSGAQRELVNGVWTVVQRGERFWLPPGTDVTEADSVRYGGADLPVAEMGEPGTYSVLISVMVKRTR